MDNLIRDGRMGVYRVHICMHKGINLGGIHGFLQIGQGVYKRVKRAVSQNQKSFCSANSQIVRKLPSPFSTFESTKYSPKWSRSL